MWHEPVHRCPECGKRYKTAREARECCMRDIDRLMREMPRKCKK